MRQQERRTPRPAGTGAAFKDEQLRRQLDQIKSTKRANVQARVSSQVAMMQAGVIEKMHRFQRGMVADAIDIGSDLLEIKKSLPHGEFHKWLATDFGEVRTAQRFMQVAAAFHSKRDTVSCLTLSTVYFLAAPSTPPEIVEATATKIECGERVDERALKSEIKIRRREAHRRKIAVTGRAKRTRRVGAVEQESQHDRDLRMLDGVWGCACETARREFFERLMSASECPAATGSPAESPALPSLITASDAVTPASEHAGATTPESLAPAVRSDDDDGWIPAILRRNPDDPLWRSAPATPEVSSEAGGPPVTDVGIRLPSQAGQASPKWAPR